jgi:ABC-type cobalamin transport system permease subunit
LNDNDVITVIVASIIAATVIIAAVVCKMALSSPSFPVPIVTCTVV